MRWIIDYIFNVLCQKFYAFKFVKVIMQNVVYSFFHANGIFDDVTVTSQLRSNMLILGQIF